MSPTTAPQLARQTSSIVAQAHPEPTESTEGTGPVYFEDQLATDLTIPVCDGQEQAEAVAGVDLDGVDDATLVELDAGPAVYDTDGSAVYDTDGPAVYDTDGSAVYDTDGDGVPDTVAITDPAGGVVLLSDVDGDGSADVVTEISGTGQITVSEHVGDGQWAVVERGRLGAEEWTEPAAGVRADDASVGFATSGSVTSGGGSSGSALSDFGTDFGTGHPVDPVVLTDSIVSVDPATGEWTTN